MNRDLFLAILSMDSYNRGYGRGIKLDPKESSDDRNEVGTRIGTATIVRQNISDAAKAAGFYGITYLIAAGSVPGVTVDTKVVMYRGSDNIPGYLDIVLDWALGRTSTSDAQNGFGVGGGSPYGPQS